MGETTKIVISGDSEESIVKIIDRLHQALGKEWKIYNISKTKKNGKYCKKYITVKYLCQKNVDRSLK